MRYVVNTLHMLSYGQQGGWRGCDNVLDEYNTGPTELVAVVDMCLTRSRRLHARTIFGGQLCRKHFGTDAARGEGKWMDNLVDVCMGKLKMINSEYVFSALEEQN